MPESVHRIRELVYLGVLTCAYIAILHSIGWMMSLHWRDECNNCTIIHTCTLCIVHLYAT